MNIPAGYQIKVGSWENDLDHPNSKTISGLSLEKASFLYELASALKDNDDQDSRLSNLYEPSDEEIEEFFNETRKIALKHRDVLTREDDLGSLVDAGADFFNDPDAVNDHISEYLYDLGLVGDEFFSRVCDSLEVFYVPDKIELQDVTTQVKAALGD